MNYIGVKVIFNSSSDSSRDEDGYWGLGGGEYPELSTCNDSVPTNNWLNYEKYKYSQLLVGTESWDQQEVEKNINMF